MTYGGALMVYFLSPIFLSILSASWSLQTLDGIVVDGKAK
tara:strand:+ start:870 stop:989 length:120 start_codon:yes stop_codon:yes gene_type:complete